MGMLPVLATMFTDGHGLALLGAGLGAGITTLGAAKGIGMLAGSAVESQARQPEAGDRIFTSMIIAAALIEGFTFFALIICFQIGSKLVEAITAAGGAATHG